MSKRLEMDRVFRHVDIPGKNRDPLLETVFPGLNVGKGQLPEPGEESENPGPGKCELV
jgi:hypothetical protein